MMKWVLPVSRSSMPGWLLWICLVNSWACLAQSERFTLRGKITDENGQELPGITVLLQGTSLGTATAADGNYSFEAAVVPGNYTLVFSALSYESQTRPVTLGTQSTVTTDVVLTETIQSLDEVVVVGSTVTTTRRELGNAISTVKAQDIVQSGSGGLLNSLQGKVPGAQIVQNSGDPAGSISVRLRGIKSLSGPSDPLYVIDGVIVSNQSTNVSQLAVSNDIGGANPGQNRLADLNPNDIQSINVINGAAAAAQYGSRAANGVVLITTKRGQNGAPRVTLTTSFNLNELRKMVPVNTYGKQFGFENITLYPIRSATPLLEANIPVPDLTTVGITRAGATSQLASNLVDVQRYNYFEEIFQTGYGTDNALSVAGGSERTQYYLSFGYLKNQGIIRGTDFTRYSIRARVDQRLANWIKLSGGVSYANSFSNEKANGNVFYSPINSVNITNNIYDINRRDAAGNLLAVEPGRVNPLSTIEDMKFTQGVNRTISDVQVNLAPLKGLSIDYILGADVFSQVGRSYIRPYPYQAQAGLPPARYPGGFAADGNNNVLLLNTDLNVIYERNFSESFKLNLTAGYNYQYSQQEFTASQGQNLAPFIETVSGATSTILTTYSPDRFNLSGYYGQFTLGYRNLAFLTGAVRRDRSTKFSPAEVNQIYPKISGSLVVSDLNFWKNASFSNVFNSLKLRASYGEAGNLTGIGTYERYYQFLPVPFLGKGTITPGTILANPSVRPERMDEIEGGVDMSFLNNRINLGATVYYQKINDLVVRRNLAPTTGGAAITNNVGSMENRGIELVLDASPVKTKDFTWEFTLIFNRVRNKVVSLINDQSIQISNVAGAPVYLIEGQPAGVFYGTTFATNPDGSLLLTSQGFPQDERGTQTGPGQYTVNRNADGQPSGSPVAAVIGDPNPDWTGSFSTNFSYKKIALHVLLDAVQGVDVFNADKRTRQGVGLGDYAERELRGELPRGYIFAVYNTEAFRVDNGSFVKLREIALSYTLPSFAKAINSLNVSLVGRNLFSWDNYNGFDPETNAGGSNDLLRAIDFGNVPIPRTYQLKLTATF